MEKYLCETPLLNFSHPNIDDFTKNIPPFSNKKELAVALYFLVRDSFIYDPYHLDLRFEALKASQILTKKRAWCVEKAILLATCARKYGIPSRLGFAIVTNHIGVEKLQEYLKKEEIVFHGYVELFLNNKWIKCTPSFDKRICTISGVFPLNWDGDHDSMFQAYQGEQKFMEYKHFYGDFEDVPIQLMHLEMKKHYPHLFDQFIESKAFSFHFDKTY